jgi:hypothetical protein
VCYNLNIVIFPASIAAYIIAKTEIEKGVGMNIQIISITFITVFACWYYRLRYYTY